MTGRYPNPGRLTSGFRRGFSGTVRAPPCRGGRIAGNSILVYSRRAMALPIEDQVVGFFDAFFGSVFSAPFQARITQPLKRRALVRQVEEAADAASQSLTRFFVNQQLAEAEVEEILGGFSRLGELLDLERVGNPNVTPEEVAAQLLEELPCSTGLAEAGHGAVYRVALHSVVQVAMLVGPVMAEWQKLGFASTYELPRRVVSRLNEISQQLDALAGSGQQAADERFELSYRDYLLQRFHRVEAGTVRMTTNLAIDLRELFVMPRLLERPVPKSGAGEDEAELAELMDLAAARKPFASGHRSARQAKKKKKEPKGRRAIDQVRRSPRLVIVGAPGSGKSTFLEWLQLQVAAVEEELVLGDQQAIPLLLRVRQLDPRNLPRGAALIEKATASRDRAALMPRGWLDRQLEAGRVLLMLDGLDEVSPGDRDRYLLPWLLELRERYPKCRFVVSSRPVGYPAGTLRRLKFVESDLLDFGDAQIEEYTVHWCTAVRLAQNEPVDEARREGRADGEQIVAGFQEHPYIRDLARTPLMLSAICLVNYFESGKLPEDRALLYKLCVEGLLHHWDQRRGIHSEFTLEEKLRTCREVALAMQAADRAESPAREVRKIIEEVLGSPERGRELFQHIRYRTGLLLERRPEVFAFAHLTFQEYLAARAVHEGNRLGVDVQQLAREHADGRWEEVIPLYCGLAPAPAAREMIELLVEQKNTERLSQILTDAFLAAGVELADDQDLRKSVLERIAVAPGFHSSQLDRFPEQEIAPIVNRCLGRIESQDTSEAYSWLLEKPKCFVAAIAVEQLEASSGLNPFQMAELVHLVHKHAEASVLVKLVAEFDIYDQPGPAFPGGLKYSSQADIALLGLAHRDQGRGGEVSRDWLPEDDLPAIDRVTLRIFGILTNPKRDSPAGRSVQSLRTFLARRSKSPLPHDARTRSDLAELARRLATRLRAEHPRERNSTEVVEALTSWAELLEKGSTSA